MNEHISGTLKPDKFRKKFRQSRLVKRRYDAVVRVNETGKTK